MKRKFMFFSGGFAAATFGFHFGVGNTVVLYLLYAAVVILCTFLFVRKNRVAVVFVAVGVILAAVLNIAYFIFDDRIPSDLDEKTHTVGAYVTDYSRENKTGKSVYFTAEVYSIDSKKLEKPIRVTVYYADIYARLNPGDRISAKASFSIPENTEDFAARTYYKTRGIDAQLFAEKDGMIFRGDKVPVKYFYKTLRYKIQQKIVWLLPEKESGFLNALIVGDKTNLSEQIKEEMRITGLSHTIAISGMHVSFLVGLLVLLFGKKYGSIIAVPVMLVFVLIAGSTPSVVRAFIMQCFVIFAPLIMREADQITSLFAALFVILFINPYAIGDVGMQLSFLSTLGLILLSGKINNKITSKLPAKNWKLHGKLINAVSKTVSATISATLFTMPVIVYYYGTISVISIVANVVVIWAVSMMFSLGVIAVMLSFVWMSAASVLASVLTWLINSVVSVVHFLSNIPFASVYAKNSLAVIGLCIMYLTLAVGYIGYRRKRVYKYAAPAGVLLCAILIFASTYRPMSKEVEFTGFDVGQGLSVMAEYRGRRVVIDCGGSGAENAGNKVYKEIMKDNTRKIDAVILTHTHSDHTNGVETLLQKANVDKLYIPARIERVAEIKSIAEIAHSRGTKVYAVEKDEKLDFGEMKVQLLCSYMSDKENNIGMSAIVKKGNFDVIITGDLEAEAEEYLVNEKYLPDTEVYIVGHHGSNSSSSDYFLNEIRPEFAVISVGKGNSYGHPSDKTLARLRKHGIVYRRTDESGDVRFASAEIFEEEE